MNTSEQNYGSLIVKVSTADGLIPVPGALVTVSLKDNGNVTPLESSFTDGSGRTGVIEIAAPAAAESLSPGEPGGADPYTTVIIEVAKEGFYSNQYTGALIFPGITTIQNAYLIPVSQSEPPFGDTIYFEGGGNGL